MGRLSWEIELQCPQCGAPVLLEETDRLLICSYCHVRLYLWTRGPFCYCLPALKAPSENLIFIPYWRFKGVAFSVIPFEIRHGIINATLLSYSQRMLPATLGIRPQALKIRFASREIQGTFIEPEMSRQEAAIRVQYQFHELEGQLLGRAPFHREFIGELGSLIFFPVFIRNGKIVDAILGKAMAPREDLLLDGARSGINEHWEINLVSTLCPNCGNPLQGGRESLLLFCGICHVLWNPSSGALLASRFEVVPGKAGSSVYLPFWRMRVAVRGISLRSYGDLARAANLPRMIRPEWEEQEAYFWVPAFRLHPALFLRLSKQMTLFQPAERTEAVLPDAMLQPVTFSEENAVACLKILLANLLSKKKDYFPKLHEISIEPVENRLVFIPFTSTGRELVHPQLGIGLQRQTLSI
ncbi:MAG: hypothetical protein ACE144_16560 [Thermodesulfobacteriota bacterium]